MLRACGCACALVLLIGGARAEESATAQARAHLTAAINAYDLGRYAEAAMEMEQAYQLKPVPDLLYNLAQCYERLNRLTDAATAYRRYLDTKADAQDRATVESRIANLDERAKALAAGQTPPPAVREKVVLKTIVVYKEAPPPPGRVARWAAYGLGVLALGAAATGIAFAILGAQAADTVSKGGNVAAPQPFDGKPRDTQESGKNDPIISGVTFGVGVLAGAGAVALYLLSKKIDREAPRVAFAPLLGHDRIGLGFAGRF
jgi:iron complex outermembrane receptor protein